MQYFETSEDTGFDDLVDTDIELVQTNSYSEDTLQQKIEETGLKKELFGCSVQLALVGWGRGNFGEVTVDGEKKPLTDIFDQAGVYYNNDAGTQLDPDDLTPKRLVRIFRFQIQKWIERRGGQSFLLKKYGTGLSDAFSPFVFPGAEHLVNDLRHARAILSCYSELDKAQGSHFSERIKSVFRSRNVAFE
jgi:hypothetical protein